MKLLCAAVNSGLESRTGKAQTGIVQRWANLFAAFEGEHLRRLWWAVPNTVELYALVAQASHRNRKASMASNGNGNHRQLASRPELEIYIEVLREALGE